MTSDEGHGQASQETLDSLDAVLADMQKAYRDVIARDEEIMGHGHYVTLSDYDLPKNAARLLEIVEIHSASPAVLGWLAERLFSGTGTKWATLLILQALHALVTGERPLVDSEMARVPLVGSGMARYEYRTHWTERLESVYGSRLREVSSSERRGEWAGAFLTQLEAALLHSTGQGLPAAAMWKKA